MLQIMLVLAEWERKQTRERTIDGMTQRAVRGLWNGGYLIGYRRVEGGKGRLEPHPEWAPKVKTFFFRQIRGVGLRQRRPGVARTEWRGPAGLEVAYRTGA